MEDHARLRNGSTCTYTHTHTQPTPRRQCFVDLSFERCTVVYNGRSTKRRYESRRTQEGIVDAHKRGNHTAIAKRGTAHSTLQALHGGRASSASSRLQSVGYRPDKDGMMQQSAAPWRPHLAAVSGSARVGIWKVSWLTVGSYQDDSLHGGGEEGVARQYGLFWRPH